MDEDRDISTSSSSSKDSIILPMKFRSSVDGEDYMLAHNVARHMGKSVVDLFRIYPNLYRRQARDDEWAFLVGKGECFSTKLTLVKASEVEKILTNSPDAQFLNNNPPVVRKQLAHSLPMDTEPSVTATNSLYQNNKIYNFTPFDKTDDKMTNVPPSHIRRHSSQAPRNVFSSLFKIIGNGPAADALQQVAELEEILVPIRLEIEIDGYKLKDTFTWNLNDRLITPEDFAVLLCEDLELPRALFYIPIVQSMKKQIADYGTFHEITLGGKEFRKTDKRIPLKIDIQCGRLTLNDQIEWDVYNNYNSPEQFAVGYCAELGLSGEYVTAIAHTILEQVINHRKAAVSGDDGWQEELPQIVFPPFRHTHTDVWTPKLDLLTDMDLEKISMAKEREARRARRDTVKRVTTSSRRSTGSSTSSSTASNMPSSGIISASAGRHFIMPDNPMGNNLNLNTPTTNSNAFRRN